MSWIERGYRNEPGSSPLSGSYYSAPPRNNKG